MSYIRCLSNPEGLYIWGDVSGDVVLSGGPAGDWTAMPQELWDKLMQAWYDDFEIGKVEVSLPLRGAKHTASIEEYLYPKEEGENWRRKFAERMESLARGEDVERGRQKVVIAYSNSRGESWKVDDIWPVTMSYITRNAVDPWLEAGWFKRKILKWLKIR